MSFQVTVSLTVNIPFSVSVTVSLARGQQVVSQYKWMRELLISCEQACQHGPEWAVWSFCQRVSNFHGPHCGPLSCSWLDLNGPFDGPPEAFHRAPCHGARGLAGEGRRGVVRAAQHLAGMPNHVSQTKQKPLCQAFIGNLFPLPHLFAFIKRRREKNRMILSSTKTWAVTGDATHGHFQKCSPTFKDP